MKIKITFKDPDSLHDAISEAVDAEKIPGLDEDEAELVKEKRKESYRKIASKWFEYGEYVTLEMDTEANTIEVVPVA